MDLLLSSTRRSNETNGELRFLLLLDLTETPNRHSRSTNLPIERVVAVIFAIDRVVVEEDKRVGVDRLKEANRFPALCGKERLER